MWRIFKEKRRGWPLVYIGQMLQLARGWQAVFGLPCRQLIGTQMDLLRGVWDTESRSFILTHGISACSTSWRVNRRRARSASLRRSVHLILSLTQAAVGVSSTQAGRWAHSTCSDFFAGLW